MATEQAAMSINGTYAAHQGQTYGGADQNYASHNASAVAYSAGQQPTSTPQSASSSGAADIPKDEVGWYFVEQYYTTLSRTPEKLFLFYNKRSQFVSGIEEEKVEVCVGQKAINDRIKELDFKDCKVRVTNVDSQGSDSNIVIQVVGEISNKNQPHRKFTQTFVLAGQTNGYFVLNDIFRYIKEEDEELPEEEVAQETAAAPAGYQEPASSAQEPVAEAPAQEVVATEEEVAQVDTKLEEVIQKEEPQRTVSPPPAQVNGTPVPEAAEVVEAEEAPVAAVSATEIPTPEQAAAEVAEETASQVEKPEDPAPTPAPEPAKAAPAPAPAAPSKPMSWAMKAASANKSVAPAVPAVPAVPAQTAAPKAAPASQAKPAPAASAPAAANASPAARSESPADNQQDGWQTAEHTKRQSRIQNQPSEPTSVRAYIKNVYENIDAEALKAALSKFDKITYFDISRPKNAAFVEFATQDGFNAAVAANPHQVGGNAIFVEERRQPGGQFQRYPSRGGSISRGRGGSDNRPGQGRGGFSKDGGRGGFTPRGRGGASTPRRGGSAAA
ncbi:hypothetical protein SLS56_007495 [Neofusicoccum ribis]|uniref:Ntf2 and rrm domain-containing protein n=1 Tax=Neofusicoccum ribis TaxID=45134 RepID=A0ABR3SMV8_9PEZI